MPNNKIGRRESVHPIYGFGNRYISVGDMAPAYTDATVALNAVAGATTSGAQNTGGARGVVLNLVLGGATTAVDLIVYRIDAGPTDTVVKTFLGVTPTTANRLFAGPGDDVDLQGKQIKIRAENLVGAGTVTVSFKRTS
jgi:hypothetical protein